MLTRSLGVEPTVFITPPGTIYICCLDVGTTLGSDPFVTALTCIVVFTGRYEALLCLDFWWFRLPKGFKLKPTPGMLLLLTCTPGVRLYTSAAYLVATLAVYLMTLLYNLLYWDNLPAATFSAPPPKPLCWDRLTYWPVGVVLVYTCIIFSCLRLTFRNWAAEAAEVCIVYCWGLCYRPRYFMFFVELEVLEWFRLFLRDWQRGDDPGYSSFKMWRVLALVSCFRAELVLEMESLFLLRSRCNLLLMAWWWLPTVWWLLWPFMSIYLRCMLPDGLTMLRALCATPPRMPALLPCLIAEPWLCCYEFLYGIKSLGKQSTWLLFFLLAILLPMSGFWWWDSSCENFTLSEIESSMLLALSLAGKVVWSIVRYYKGSRWKSSDSSYPLSSLSTIILPTFFFDYERVIACTNSTSTSFGLKERIVKDWLCSCCLGGFLGSSSL